MIKVGGRKGRLRQGARGNAVEPNFRRERRGYRSQKRHYGAATYAPEPQHDWTEIRAAKVLCEKKCGLFNPVLGECRLHLLPGLECPGLNMKEALLVKQTKNYTRYKHKDSMVWVRKDLKGRHREHCLCWSCENFRPDKADNCGIATALFALCRLYEITTPVFECSRFRLTDDLPERDPNWPF